MVSPSRRAFLRTLLLSPLALTMDVEQLLWTPSPMITVPGVGIRGFSIAELNAVTLREIGYPSPLLEHLFMTTPLLAYLRDTNLVTVNG